MEHYLVIKISKLLIHETMWLDLRNMPNESRVSQEYTVCGYTV